MSFRNAKRTLVSIFACLTVGSTSVQSASAQAKANPQEWSYEGREGPAHWGDLAADYATCRLGLRQSPIDIRDARQESLQPIKFDYRSSPLKIINNGHTIQVDYARGSMMSAGGKRYELRQFHFHHPSEEEINGKPYDMVIHVVHQDGEGHLAVVAVLLTEGKANTAIQKLWDHVPRVEGKEESPAGIEINAADLLPETLGYYAFEGSLTTPPCSESVAWYVLKMPMEVSSREVAVFGKLYPHNARPVQPRNGRAILESK